MILYLVFLLVDHPKLGISTLIQKQGERFVALPALDQSLDMHLTSPGSKLVLNSASIIVFRPPFKLEISRTRRFKNFASL